MKKQDFEETKRYLQEHLELCLNYNDLRLYFCNVLEVINEDYKNLSQEKRLVDILEKMNKGENNE